MKRRALLLSTSLLAVGCARPLPTDYGQVPSTIATKIDKQVEWFQGSPGDQINDFVHSLLSHALSPEAAIQIALLKNPKVQSIFEELGMAYADLVEAGLLSNPDFSLEVRYPQKKACVTNIEYLVTATFLDLFLIPLRTRLAAAHLEQVKRSVTHEILNLAFDVRQAYYELVAEQQKLRYIEAIAELSDIQREIVSRQFAVGNVYQLSLQQAQAQCQEAKLEIGKQQSTIICLKEQLNRLLGLGEAVCLILPEMPQEFDYKGFDLCKLESAALAERMDLQEARFEVIRLRRALGLKDWWVYTGLQAGVAGERDPDGVNVIGFGLSGQIPIFNYGQAARMRLSAQLRQAQRRYEALEIHVLSQVREAHKVLMNNLGMIGDYQVRIIPLLAEISKSAEPLYNVMGLGVDRLLESKRRQLEADRRYLETLKDYWVARVQLDKALGGYLFRLVALETSTEEICE